MYNMKNIKRIFTAIAALMLLLPSYSQEKADSVYEFRFVSGNNRFFSPYKDNEMELARLMKCIELHKESITQEKSMWMVTATHYLPHRQD